MIINIEKKASGVNIFGAKSVSDNSWLEALPVDVRRVGGSYAARTTDGVWVSAGASYGAQVEFSSFEAAQAFIAQNPGTARAAAGTTHPRVVCDTKAVFVAAYHAAAGKQVKSEEKAEAPVPLASLVAPVVASDIDEEIAALEVAIKAKKAAKAANDEKAKKKAELLAELAALDEE